MKRWWPPLVYSVSRLGTIHVRWASLAETKLMRKLGRTTLPWR